MRRLLTLVFLSIILGCSERGDFISPQVTKESEQVVELTWAPPTRYIDGTPLPMSDVGGYKIYYGDMSGNYKASVDIPDNYTMKYKFKNLPIPTYFAVTCYSTTGAESKYSNEAVYD